MSDILEVEFRNWRSFWNGFDDTGIVRKVRTSRQGRLKSDIGYRNIMIEQNMREAGPMICFKDLKAYSKSKEGWEKPLSWAYLRLKKAMGLWQGLELKQNRDEKGHSRAVSFMGWILEKERFLRENNLIFWIASFALS